MYVLHTEKYSTLHFSHCIKQEVLKITNQPTVLTLLNTAVITLNQLAQKVLRGDKDRQTDMEKLSVIPT
jgi:hypothetical protein